MNAFTKTVSDSLEKMIRIRQEFFDNYDDLVRSNEDQQIPNRLCHIYGNEANRVLVEMLFKLELIETNENYGQHNIGSIIKNFWHPETEKLILSAYYNCDDKEEIQSLVCKVENFGVEMQDCLNNLWCIAEERILQD